jgi:beta-lactamase class C
MRRRTILGAGAAIALPSAAAAQGRNLVQAVEQAFVPLLAKHDIPGLVVATTDNGLRQFFEFGVASRESGARATAATLFEIGSLSKCFAAVVGGRAMAAGRMQLRDAPSRFWPALRGHAIDRATLLHLGTYTPGGLPLQFPDAVSTPDAALGYYQGFAPTAAPGTVRQYSNPSIGLFGHLAAKSLGRDYVEFVESTMLPALGLSQTHLRVPAPAMSGYAWGYDRANKPVRVNPGVFDAEAYGVKTTARDLLRFVELNMDPSSLPPQWQRALQATHVGHFEVGTMAQGLGWEQYPAGVSLQQLLAGNTSEMALQPQKARALTARALPRNALLNKTGSTNGFGAYAAFVPDRRMGVVMLANRNFPNADRCTAAHSVLTAMGALG